MHTCAQKTTQQCTYVTVACRAWLLLLTWKEPFLIVEDLFGVYHRIAGAIWLLKFMFWKNTQWHVWTGKTLWCTRVCLELSLLSSGLNTALKQKRTFPIVNQSSDMYIEYSHVPYCFRVVRRGRKNERDSQITKKNKTNRPLHFQLSQLWKKLANFGSCFYNK